jgi:hypothetical protein
MTLSRSLLLRALGGVFLVAFVSVGTQLDALVGPNGIGPLSTHLGRLAKVIGAHPWSGNLLLDRYLTVPTLSWFVDPGTASMLWVGLGGLASLALLLGRFQAPALLVCWVTYLSICHDTQRFLSFQWDTLLLEVGFAALLVAPWRWRAIAAAPTAGWWLLRWILFKLVFFGGLVKLASGDPTWWDGTALTFHYETQPLPNPLSWHAHWLPAWVHVLSTGLTFLIELVLVFGIFGTRPMRRVAAVSIAMLMGLLFVTGNYGFFQVLTVVLCLVLVDDADWRRLLPKRWHPSRRGLPEATGAASAAAGFVALTLFATSLIGAVPRYTATALPPQLEQWRAATAPFRTVNQYGLFAVMTKTRPIPILEAQWDDGEWTELTWRFQTADPAAAPPVIAPHMPRLDWMVWFAGLSSCNRHRWMLEVQRQLVNGSEPVSELVGDLKLRGAPPTAVRSVLYEYRFTEPGSPEAAEGRWWTRERKGPYCPAVKR